MTGQDALTYENEALDQYNRDIEYVDSWPSPRNTGWYNEFLPIQRYVMYQVNYRVVAEEMMAGNVDGIDDESFLLLAYAVRDDEAVEAYEEQFASNPAYKAIHEQVYGKAT